MANPGRVIPARMIDHILLFVAHVAHVARLCQPGPARGRVVLDLIAGPDTGAGARVEPGVSGIHGLNHLSSPLSRYRAAASATGTPVK